MYYALLNIYIINYIDFLANEELAKKDFKNKRLDDSRIINIL